MPLVVHCPDCRLCMFFIARSQAEQGLGRPSTRGANIMSLMCRSFRSTCFGATQVLDNVDQARPSVGQTAEISSAPGGFVQDSLCTGPGVQEKQRALGPGLYGSPVSARPDSDAKLLNPKMIPHILFHSILLYSIIFYYILLYSIVFYCILLYSSIFYPRLPKETIAVDFFLYTSKDA